MNRWIWKALRWMGLLATGGCVFQLAGCARIFTQEANVVFAGDANPTLIAGSILLNVFGPAIRVLFN